MAVSVVVGASVQAQEVEAPNLNEAEAEITPTAERPWRANCQATYVWQDKPAFHATYTGPYSLLPTKETGYTLTSTLFLGLRPWAGTELFFNPETIQSAQLSDLRGLGGMSNGENQKGGGPTVTAYVARLFLRQTIGLGGDSVSVAGGANQFVSQQHRRRLVLTAGKIALIDVFDNNTFAHDPRVQFANWSLMTYGAFDFAADARGYTWGLAAEYYYDDWVFRIGRFAQPKESNGLPLDFNVLAHYGDNLEIEHDHSLWGHAGKVRLLGFRNVAHMGNFRDALHMWQPFDGPPDVAAVRITQAKVGFGFSAEQEITPNVGAFVRGSWNDGQTETYAFTEVECSLTAGVAVKGTPWIRPGDTFGFAVVQNELSQAHIDYLAAGGHGFFIGDGRISYRPERIAEAYYSMRGFDVVHFSLDGQYIVNPAYNAARGPVVIFGGRVHLEY